MEMKQARFLIVGAGPAGLTLAYLLARDGYVVELISREKEFKRQLCGEYLSPTGKDLLKTLPGVSQGFEAIEGMRICASGFDLQADFPLNATGLSVIRGQLESRLYRLALEAGAEISLGESFQDSMFHAGRHIVKTCKRTIQADFLIGADGRKSRVAQKLGLMKKPDTSRTAVGVIAQTSESRRMGEMHLLSDSCYLGMDPNSATEANLSVVVPSRLLRTSRPAQLLRSLLKEAGEDSRFEFLDSEVKTTSPITHRPRKVDFPQGCLMGDAAGFADPITGEGMTMAFRNAFLLMDLIRKNVSLHQLSASYARKHQKLIRPKFLLKPAFDALVHFPALHQYAGKLLTLRPNLLTHLLGLIGQVYTPRQFFRLSAQELAGFSPGEGFGKNPR